MLVIALAIGRCICIFRGGAHLNGKGALMQAGLSALKTPQSYSSTSNKEDPLSTEVSNLLFCTPG